jgi:hypothetical protein
MICQKYRVSSCIIAGECDLLVYPADTRAAEVVPKLMS